jgi:hypothetical protein
MRRSIIILSLFVAAATLTASSAYAQGGGTGPAPATSSTGSASFNSATSSHGRGVGLGAITMLNGTNGALFTWGSGGGGLHIDAFFGMRHYSPNGNTTTSFSLGGRFWYHMHAASFADFSLGGGLGILRWQTNPGNPGNDDRLDLCLQVGAQIRAFVVPNVALIADLGLGVYFGGTDDVLIGGQAVGGGQAGGENFVSGTLGIAYFFE